jgi:biopolymer transport protein ExbB/TolQ
VHVEMTRGLSILATIAVSAPFLGVLGTLLGIVNPFERGYVGERWGIYAALMGSLAESLMPTELGLLIALLAFCGFKYFQARAEAFDAEMQDASFQLLKELASRT